MTVVRHRAAGKGVPGSSSVPIRSADRGCCRLRSEVLDRWCHSPVLARPPGVPAGGSRPVTAVNRGNFTAHSLTQGVDWCGETVQPQLDSLAIQTPSSARIGTTRAGRSSPKHSSLAIRRISSPSASLSAWAGPGRTVLGVFSLLEALGPVQRCRIGECQGTCRPFHAAVCEL